MIYLHERHSLYLSPALVSSIKVRTLQRAKSQKRTSYDLSDANKTLGHDTC